MTQNMPVRAADRTQPSQTDSARKSFPRPSFLMTLLSLSVRIAPTGRKFFRRSILFRRSLASLEPVAPPEGVRWSLAGPNEIAWINAHPEATSRSAYRRRYERGDICVCLKNGSEIVAYRWIVRSAACQFCGFGLDYEIRFLPLSSKQAFLYDLYVYQAHRRFGYGTLLCRIIFRILKEKGVDEVFCLAEPGNERIVSVNLRLGFEAVRIAYGVRIWRLGAMFFGPLRDRQLEQWIGEFGARAKSHSTTRLN